jgi:hypothetical protein
MGFRVLMSEIACIAITPKFKRPARLPSMQYEALLLGAPEVTKTVE